jgi:trehalose 6-phosphate phosphatase
VTEPEFARGGEQVRAFAARVWADERLTRLRVRAEDKAEIAAFHWRGAPDEAAAEAAVREIADAAVAEGLHIHWGRKVLEVRPAVEVDKGAGIAWLLADADVDHAVYVGDDTTDLDAFRGLRDLVAAGRLASAVCVGVRSDETPPELERQADLLVDGPAGVRSVLEALL